MTSPDQMQLADDPHQWSHGDVFATTQKVLASVCIFQVTDSKVTRTGETFLRYHYGMATGYLFPSLTGISIYLLEVGALSASG